MRKVMPSKQAGIARAFAPTTVVEQMYRKITFARPAPFGDRAFSLPRVCEMACRDQPLIFIQMFLAQEQ